MAPTRPARRSARERRPTKKYTTDPFAGLESVIYHTSDSGSDTTILEETDREFSQEDPVVTPQDEVLSDVQPESQSDGDWSGTASDEGLEVYDDDSDGARTRRTPRKGTGGQNAPVIKRTRAAADHLSRIHTRGVLASRKLGRENRVLVRFGPGEEDVVAHARTRDKWVNQPGLPTKVEKGGRGGGLGYSFFWPQEKMEREAKEGWKWYCELGGQELFRSLQTTHLVDSSEVNNLLATSLLSANSILLGPVREEKLHQLHPQETLNLETAWPGSWKRAPRRRGWLINIGTKLQCLAWVPNQKGTHQYLSIAVRHNKESGPSVPSAFSPRGAARSCLQFWELQDIHKSSLTASPKLRAVLSFDWNDIRRLKWCPALKKDTVLDNNPTELRLGLLAGVWLDGYVRILDVVVPVSDSVTYIHINKATFEIKPPGTICTSVTWLSSTTLAVGCANGYVGIWSVPEVLGINDSGNTPQSATGNTRPWFYKPLHQNFVTAITSGYPSRPHLLFTNGADGHTKMTDLRDPRADVCSASRNRGPFLPLVWHDHTQLALSTGEAYQIRAHTARQFHMSFGVGRCESMCLDFAISPVHPMLLASSDDGSVISINLNRKTHGARINVTLSHMWFNYEWRDGFSEEAVQDMCSGPGDPEDLQAQSARNTLRSPLGRFSEGYKPQKAAIDETSRSAVKDGIAYSTIYEDLSAVNLICWNPNIRYGTWAAAATGSGLVRVEDLAIRTADES